MVSKIIYQTIFGTICWLILTYLGVELPRLVVAGIICIGWVSFMFYLIRICDYEISNEIRNEKMKMSIVYSIKESRNRYCLNVVILWLIGLVLCLTSNDNNIIAVSYGLTLIISIYNIFAFNKLDKDIKIKIENEKNNG